MDGDKADAAEQAARRATGVGAASAVTITVSTGDTATALLNKINAVANVEASYTTEGYLKITSTNNEDLILSETTNTPLDGLGITAATYTLAGSPSASRTAAASDFATLRTQIDQLASDAVFSGVNLLLGDNLKINFNETGSSSLTVSVVTFDASGLSIAAAQNNFQLDTDITAAKADLERALDTLRDFSSTLSTNITISEVREDFNAGFRDLLQTGADELTLADVQEESANLLALQTRRDLAITALSILQTAERGVLSLF